MEYIIIPVAALLASGLTLFSGFGLGTILVPVFAIFFPLDIAIALTAIVHFLNNLFKVSLLGRYASKTVIWKFGIVAFIFSFIGAELLFLIKDYQPLYAYSLIGHTYYIYPLKLIVGFLIMFFSLFDLLPALNKISFDKKYLPLGGIISGFFGGLSGHQGALRSAFLIKSGLSKETYIATGIVIAVLVDISRLAVYFNSFSGLGQKLDYSLLSASTLAAFSGAYIGSKLIKKITINALQIIVGVLLILVGMFIVLGII